MTLPAFADVDALAARIPGGISDDDRPRAQAALDDAAALIRAEAGNTWANDAGTALDADLPDIIVTICVSVARRAFVNADQVESETETFDRFSHQRNYGDSSLDVYLKASEKALIRRAAGGHGGLTTISTTREDPIGANDFGTLAADGTIYVDVTPDGQPLPFLNEGEFR